MGLNAWSIGHECSHAWLEPSHEMFPERVKRITVRVEWNTYGIGKMLELRASPTFPSDYIEQKNKRKHHSEPG